MMTWSILVQCLVVINEIYGVKGIDIIPRKKVLKQKPYYATVRLIPDKLTLSLLFTSFYSLVITDSFCLFLLKRSIWWIAVMFPLHQLQFHGRLHWESTESQLSHRRKSLRGTVNAFPRDKPIWERMCVWRNLSRIPGTRILSR